MITRDCLDKIKNSVDIYDVVSPYVTLKRCGVNWRGLSPFNQEKTPSFFVMPAKKMFRCFSSGNAGDIFRFIQLKENVSFGDAVEMIAERFNIPLEFEKSATLETKPYAKKTLFDLHGLVCDFFVKNFHAANVCGEKIRQYWVENRKFSLDVAKENGIGFAGNDDRALVGKIRQAGYSLDAIKASGIFYAKENETDPHRFMGRFNSRLTIPIRNTQGKIVGFSARFIDGMGQQNNFADAKYINSPATEIFQKGSILFGLDRARQYLEPNGPFWMVEGQFDAMRCWDNGINTAIAPQGTAITDAQLSTLRRYSVHLNCMLDGDNAGLKAAERLLTMAITAGLDVKFFILPEGQDPDSYFCEDFENRFQGLQRSGMTGIEFLANRWLAKKNITAQEKVETLRRIYEIISIAESSIVQKSYLDELSMVANLDRHAIFQDFKSFLQKKPFVGNSKVVTDETQKMPQGKLSTAESQLLAIVLSNDRIAKQILDLYEQPFLQNLTSREGKVLLKILNEIKEYMWEGIAKLEGSPLFSDDEKNLIYFSLADFDEDCEHLAIANLCLRKLHSNFIKEEINKVNDNFRKISLDESDSIKTLQECRLNLRKMLEHPPQIVQL
ncbi:MAG: DNA primase [Puniceicoccales bacterium]|jgi:DNA primase|nr:DNA primase [Puniceicoccales bacterium]